MLLLGLGEGEGDVVWLGAGTGSLLLVGTSDPIKSRGEWCFAASGPVGGK